MIQPNQAGPSLNPKAIPTPFSGGGPTPPQPAPAPMPAPSPVAPPPVSPQGPAGMPPVSPDQGGAMASPEQRAELEDLMNKAQGKMGELQTAKFVSANEEDASNAETLKEIFIMLRDSGVDLTNPNSVAEFLEKLKGINPTLGQQFEDTLVTLMDGAEQQQPQNPNETIQEDVRGPLPG